MYTDASGPAIELSNRTSLFRSHHHPAMVHPYLSGEPGVEQLVRAFAQVLDSNSPLGRCVHL
jgi:hypothetical protein